MEGRLRSDHPETRNWKQDTRDEGPAGIANFRLPIFDLRFQTHGILFVREGGETLEDSGGGVDADAHGFQGPDA
jgi:hypothetical protein